MFNIKYILFCLVLSASAFASSIYPGAVQTWPITDPSQDNIEVVFDEMATLDNDKLQKARPRLMQDLDEGTCYGEAVNFMLENPPHQPEMQFLDTAERQQNVIRVQAQQNFDAELNDDAKQIKKHLRKKESELTKKDLKSYKKINQHLSKNNRLKQKFSSFESDITFQDQLDKTVRDLYSSKEVVKVEEGAMEHGNASNKTFAKDVIKEYRKMQRKTGFSDIVFGFDFVDHEGAGDHAILVQHTHLRIYDAAHGIYQYDSLNKLLGDLEKRFAALKENAYVDYETFKHKN